MITSLHTKNWTVLEMASPFPPRTLVFKIVTCTVFIMVHNTAYPTPSGYDARKHVKLLRPVVYVILPASHAKKKQTPLDHMRDQQELASWLSSPELRNFHHFQIHESAERKQKFIEGKGDFYQCQPFLGKIQGCLFRFSFVLVAIRFRYTFHLYSKII